MTRKHILKHLEGFEILAPAVFDEVVVIQAGKVYGSGYNLLDGRPSKEVLLELYYAYCESWGLAYLMEEFEKELRNE